MPTATSPFIISPTGGYSIIDVVRVTDRLPFLPD